MKAKLNIVAPGSGRISLSALLVLVAAVAFGADQLINTDSSAASEPRLQSESPAPSEAVLMTANTCESLPGGVIEVEGTGGSGAQPTGYATLGAAFAAINNGAHTAPAGTIFIDVCGNTSEGGSAVLSASGAGPGPASYNAILIRPVGGAARTISGTVAAPLIDLSGADNVTIDGLSSGGNALTITNLNTGTTTTTSTIRFIGDATNNTITNSSILGSATMTSGTNGGTIFFSTAGTPASGNDNNTISNCNIGPSTATLPTKAIYGNGTTTSTTHYNSGISITGNNIFDFFNNTGQRNGVLIAGANTGWLINGNRFYQSAPRIQTTGAVHAPVQIGSGTADNITISGNTIGYANSAGTGIYDVTGTGTLRTYPIYFSTHGPTPSSIQGNTITNITIAGSVSGNPFSGISIQAGRADIGNVTGNVIGSSTSSGAISMSSSSPSNSTVFGIDHSASGGNINTSNNIVAGITATNTSTGAIGLFGIRMSTSTSNQTSTAQNNTIGTAAAPIVNNATSASSNVFGLWFLATTPLTSGNIISSMTMVAGNTSTGTSAAMIGLLLDAPSTTAGYNISTNTVRNLSNTDTVNNVSVIGIYINSGIGPHFVQRNLVYGLSAGDATSTTGTVSGIDIQTGSTTYQNNMIALGNSISGGNQINGIRQSGAGTANFYHNSIYIGGTGVVGSQATYAMHSSITNNNREFRDNIFVNARSNGSGTGKHYALRMGGSGTNPLGLLINNNVYLANGTGGIFGTYQSVDRANLAAWQVAIGQDANSFSADPQYVNPSGATPDLHINPGSPTVVEAGGADVGVGDDFDGQTRSGLTPVDIGADAGNFTPIGGGDTTPPTISYTALTNTTSTANRVLSAVIADDTAVANGGLLPRVYFRKNAGAYFSTQCVLQSGNQQSGTYDCTIDNSLMGGVAGGDVVGYFVIAQDTSGNIRSNPAGVVATNVNTVTTPPTPNTYNILQTFTGPMSVGTGETITSLTNNGGLFQALNAGVMTGNLVVNITSDMTVETGTHSLNQLAEEGVGGYTIFFQASGGSRLISGASPLGTGLITMNGADRVTFSGLAFGPGGLTFRNTGNAATIRFLNDSTFDSVLGCVVEGGVLDLDSGVVLIGNGTTTGNNNLSISNSTIRDRTDAAGVPANLIRNAGTPTVSNSNTLVVANVLINFTNVGVFNSRTNNSQINGNNISQTAARTSDLFGVVFQGTGTNTISGNTIRDQNTDAGFTGMLLETDGSLSVSANRIFNIDNAGGNTFPWVGIQLVALLPGSNLTAVNNMVSLVPSSPSSGADLTGIFIDGLAGNFNVNHNSVLLGGPGGADSWAMRRNSTSASTVSMSNNIFFNDRTGSDNHFAAGDAAGGMGSWSSDYNLYVGTGASAANFFEYNGSAVDFTAWKAGPPARDANSLASVANAGPYNVGNMFASANDLHLGTLGFNPAINAGTDIGLTTDFDGQTRPFNGTPDIGADEVQVAPTAGDAAIGGRIMTADGRGIKNVRVVVMGGDLIAPVSAISNSFGYFRIDGLEAGQSYVVSVSGKRYVFEPATRVVSLGEDAFDINFVGQTR